MLFGAIIYLCLPPVLGTSRQTSEDSSPHGHWGIFRFTVVDHGFPGWENGSSSMRFESDKSKDSSPSLVFGIIIIKIVPYCESYIHTGEIATRTSIPSWTELTSESPSPLRRLPFLPHSESCSLSTFSRLTYTCGREKSRMNRANAFFRLPPWW